MIVTLMRIIQAVPFGSARYVCAVQVLGRNCRFLQGKGTDKQAISDLRQAVKNGEETTVRILNYRKDGHAFWNMLTVAPMGDSDGQTRFFIGVQVEASVLCAKYRSEICNF